MRAYIISDIHLDFGGAETIFDSITDQVNKFECDTIIIAGDVYPIEYINQPLNIIARRHKNCKIIFVIGNHEFYFYDFNEIDQLIDQARKNLESNVAILDNDCLVIDDIMIHGFTGWIDESWQQIHYPAGTVKQIYFEKNYSDFKTIDHFYSSLEKGKNDFKDFVSRMKFYEDEAFQHVVVTHFMPCKELVSVKYAGSPLNPCFSNDWREEISKININLVSPIKYWIHGHTHEKQSYTMDGVQFICNPVGYHYERGYGVSPYIITI